MDKATLRHKLRLQLQSIKNVEGRNIVQKIKQHPQYMNAASILMYVSTSTEVSTDEIIKYALRHGKTVLIPDTKELKVYKLTDVLLLEGRNKDTFFVPKDLEVCEPANIDLAIVPGLAFTKNGDRLGRGRGWYDRFLNAYDIGYTIGVCYPGQIVDDLPVEAHDVRVDEVVW